MWVRKQEGCLWRLNWKESLFPRAGTPGWPQVGAWRKSFVETLHTGAQGGEKLIPNENPQKIQELSLKTNKWGCEDQLHKADLLLNCCEFHQGPLTRLVAYRGLQGEQGGDQGESSRRLLELGDQEKGRTDCLGG